MRRKVDANPSQPTQAMADFTKTTETRAAEKKKVSSVRGFGKRPELRQKQRARDLRAPPQEPRVPADTELLIAVHSGIPSRRRDPYKRLTGRALSAAAGFEVDSIRAVYDGYASTPECLLWLEVLARGLLVQELAGAKKHQFPPAYRQVKAAVQFSTQFEEAQPALVDRFTNFEDMPKSQWKRAADADPKKAHVIKTLEDFRVPARHPASSS